MEREIRDTLDRIETREDVRVLYAVESGSRAWGFASTDSDWDVRFLYLRRPEWYLSIQRRRDVLEYPLADGLDVSGWDLKKALGLFAKSNPPLLEWLRSPIVYREAFSAAARLRVLSTRYFSPPSCMHHYLSMAEGNYREYLQRDPVRVKKYFYVLRPVLACRWIEMHGTTPPTEFAALVADQLPTPGAETLQPTLRSPFRLMPSLRRISSEEIPEPASYCARDRSIRAMNSGFMERLTDSTSAPSSTGTSTMRGFPRSVTMRGRPRSLRAQLASESCALVTSRVFIILKDFIAHLPPADADL